MPQQRTCLFSAATLELPKNPNYHGDPKKRPTQAKWTHDGQCETLPYYKERTAKEDKFQKKPKWKLTTYKMESDQCKKICEPGKQKHCCIATCDLFDRKGNTCKLSKLAPEWYLSSADLEDNKWYKSFKGWDQVHDVPTFTKKKFEEKCYHSRGCTEWRTRSYATSFTEPSK